MPPYELADSLRWVKGHGTKLGVARTVLISVDRNVEDF